MAKSVENQTPNLVVGQVTDNQNRALSNLIVSKASIIALVLLAQALTTA